MNIIDAIKSGKPFRCDGHVRYAHHDKATSTLVWDTGETVAFGPTIDDLSVEDLLSNEWEIKEPEVTITESQFRAMIREAVQGRTIDNSFLGTYSDPTLQQVLDHLEKKLFSEEEK